jgi:hypothetical protein
MAISERNVSSLSQASAATIVLNKPTGVVNGDVMFAFLHAGANGSGTHATLAGWTEIAFAGGGTVRPSNITVLRKVAGGSEPTTYTFSGQSLVDGSIVALIGADTTTPEDVAASGTTGSTTSADAPSLTTVTSNAWHLVGYGSSTVNTTLALPTGYTNDVPAYGDSAGAGFQDRVDHKLIAAAGATGIVSSVVAPSSFWVAISVAVRPGVSIFPANKDTGARFNLGLNARDRKPRTSIGVQRKGQPTRFGGFK